MNQEFAIDLDLLESAKGKYESFLEDFENALKNAEKGLDELKANKWEGKGKDAFFEKAFADWKRDMEKYKEKIQILKDMVNEADERFDELDKEAKELNNNFI